MTEPMVTPDVPFAINESVPQLMGRAWVKPLRLTTIGVGLVTAISVIESVKAFGLIGTYAGLEAGRVSFRDALDAEDSYTVISFVSLAAFVVVAILMMFATHRLASALRDKPGVRLQYQPKWAVIGWLIPFLNLVRPAQVMKDLDRATSGSIPEKHPTIGLWWGLMIVKTVLSQIAVTTESLSLFAWTNFLSDLLTIPAGIALVLILQRFSRNASTL